MSGDEWLPLSARSVSNSQRGSWAARSRPNCFSCRSAACIASRCHLKKPACSNASGKRIGWPHRSARWSSSGSCVGPAPRSYVCFCRDPDTGRRARRQALPGGIRLLVRGDRDAGGRAGGLAGGRGGGRPARRPVSSRHPLRRPPRRVPGRPRDEAGAARDGGRARRRARASDRGGPPLRRGAGLTARRRPRWPAHATAAHDRPRYARPRRIPYTGRRSSNGGASTR